MKKDISVLITGVAGLLGSRLADWISENIQESTIVGIDDLSGGYKENINEKVIFYQKELSGSDLSEIFEKHKFDYVFHFAAYAAEGLSPFIRKYNYTNNILSTANIINECINYKVKRLVFTSSMAVYGEGNPPFSEDTKRNPIDPYGVAKAACEMDIEIAYKQHGLEYCIIRPHNVYGDKQNIWDRYRNVLGIWMYQKLNGQPFTIYGDGLQTRAFSFIDDSLPCFWNAAVLEEAKCEIINLGGIKSYSLKDSANILSKIVGGNDIIHLEQRHEVKHAFSTYQKSVEILKFEHKVDLREGLEKMWQWAEKQPMRARKSFEKYEISEKLYYFWK
jgi:UDP-glucose 4-epimerase